MISPTANWQTRNSGIKKKPIFLIEIEGYGRAFSSAALGIINGLPASVVVQVGRPVLNDFGGLGTFDQAVPHMNPTPAGNLLFAFMYNGDGGTSQSISDDAGNSWTLLYSSGAKNVAVWYCVSVATSLASRNVNGTMVTCGNVIHFVSGANFANSEAYVVEVPAAYAGFTSTTATGTGTVATATSGGNSMSVNFAISGNWTMFLAALAPASGATAQINLAFIPIFSGTPSAPLDTSGRVTGTEAFGPNPSNTYVGNVIYVLMGATATTVDWIVSIDPISLTVADLDGGADLSDLVFNIQDTAEIITSDLKLFTFEGKRCILKHGFGKQVGNQVVFDSTFPLSDYLTRFTGKINSVANDNGNQEYKFTVPDIRKDMSKVIYQTGDDGFPTDSTHTRTVSGHPLDILISILQNELGYRTSAIDIAGITAYRDTVLSGIEFSFVIDSPPAAKDFIENELMKPLGAYHFTDNNGVVKVHFFYPISPVTVATLDHTNLGTVPAAGQADLVNQVTFRFDKSSSSFLSESLQQWQPSITKFGLFGEQVIESAGLRSAFIGFFIAQFIARLIFLRYGDKQLQIEDLQTIFDDSSLLEPGDYVLVTSALLPDRAQGMVGVTAKTFEVMDRTWDCIAGVTTLKLLEIDLSLFRQFWITPNGEADFTADTAPHKALYMYQSNAAGVYSDGSPGNTLC